MCKKRKNRLWIEIITVLLILCFTACGVEHNSEVMPSATPTVTEAQITTLPVTPTLLPTKTPLPTDIPTEIPVPTPQPTVTVAPTPEPIPTEPMLSALEHLRALLAANNSYCGVAYLGYAESIEEFLASGAAEEYKEEFSFLWELPKENLVSCGGMEIYCVVPVSETMSVSVYELVYDWESTVIEGIPGTELYRAENGTPALIQGNASDIIPNMQVVLTLENGEQKRVTPYISLRDGSTAVTGDAEGVYDFTKYPEGFVKEE